MLQSIILVICITCLAISSVSSQSINPSSKQVAPKIEVIAKSYLDSIVVRWAPNSPEVWQYGNQYGYIIERSILARDTNYFLNNSEKKILTSKPIKPIPLATWESLTQQNKYAGIAAQAIYGKSFEVVDQSDSFITFFNQAKEMENRFSFSLFAADQSVDVAQAHGLRFVDQSVSKNERYLYRIHIPVPDSSLHIETGFIYVASRDTVVVPQPQQLEIEFGDRIAQLSWNKQYYDHIFTSYIVERTNNLAKGFERIQQPPIINPTSARQQPVRRMYITDSLPDNSATYYYRIRGVTPFGEISPPSDTVSGRGIPAVVSVHPMITNHRLLSDNRVKLQWEFPQEYNTQIKGFRITRSDQANGIYDTLSIIIGSAVRFYIDRSALPVNYYMVQAIDLQGRINNSMPTMVQLEDSIPPLPPIGLNGQIDTLGKVEITWQNNTEPDVAGYRVLMANNSEGPFVQISDDLIKENHYTSQTIVKTLSKYIYYRLVAVDKRYNRSQPSEVLRLERPDVVPPAPPVFQQAIAIDSAIQLSWVSSPSSDVVKHVLYRRQLHFNAWEIIAAFDSILTVSTYTDQEVIIGHDYEYRMIAVDRAGLASVPSVSIKVSALDHGLRPPITQYYGKADRNAKHVQLAWNYTQKDIEKFLLYRTAENQPLRLLKALPSDRNSFLDQNLIVNTTYTYRIQAIYTDGGQSPLSEELTVNY